MIPNNVPGLVACLGSSDQFCRAECDQFRRAGGDQSRRAGGDQFCRAGCDHIARAVTPGTSEPQDVVVGLRPVLISKCHDSVREHPRLRSTLEEVVDYCEVSGHSNVSTAFQASEGAGVDASRVRQLSPAQTQVLSQHPQALAHERLSEGPPHAAAGSPTSKLEARACFVRIIFNFFTRTKLHASRRRQNAAPAARAAVCRYFNQQMFGVLPSRSHG
ncbi:hypothetical protein ENSA7_43140 [Enhygromyxa salina]|uniref:Uncharacterized protein n=1 Tax=Enhygromyxa salina TaxID=215803 RepID=A0A2S9YLX6_9BACT|nr:hypothetical protein ENSA7_43140 [Enhygromyxa salina]